MKGYFNKCSASPYVTYQAATEHGKNIQNIAHLYPRIAIFYPKNIIKWRTKSSHQPWLRVRLNIIPVTGTIS